MMKMPYILGLHFSYHVLCLWFMNLMVQNTAPRPDPKTPGGQAVALRISGDKAAFYNCKMYGFQDTICDDRNRHFFKDCLIQGTMDYIFGSGKSLYVVSKIS